MSRNYTGAPTAETKQYIGQVSDSNPAYVRKDLLLARGYTDLVLYTWTGSAYSAVPLTDYDPQAAFDTLFSQIVGTTIYTQFSILNVAYYNVDLYADFNDYGAQTDADIRSDELRETTWMPNGSYSSVGAECRYYGVKYISYTTDDKTGLIPPLNKNQWFPVPDRRELIFRSSEPVPSSGIHGIHDRSSSNYQSYLAVDEWTVGATTLRTYMVHLDGSTPDTTLQAALDAYDYTSYFTDSGDLIDMDGRVCEFGTNASGYVPTMGEVHDDYMMRIQATLRAQAATNIGMFQSSTGAISLSSQISARPDGSGSGTRYLDMTFDSANSTSPQPAKTNDDRTAPAAQVIGAAYIYITVNTADL